LFYDPNARYTQEDFYANNTADPISITVIFSDLSDNEKKLLGSYVFGDTLTIEKELHFPPSRMDQKYYGWELKNPDFENFRTAKGVSELRQAYKSIVQEEKYASFPLYTRKEEVEATLAAWEESHPEQCEKRRVEGQFFGFKEVGESRLERFTRFLFVPAVQDASQEAAETRGSMISQILDMVVRNALAKKPEFVQLQEQIQRDYGSILDPANIPELLGLSGQLTKTLQNFVPNAGVDLSWEPKVSIDLPFPPDNIRLREDGYLSPVDRTGHGLQRAFVLTMFQHLAYAQATQPTEESEETRISMPNLIIGIEEPELYQHPDRQRHFSKTLLKLSEGNIPGVSDKIQIIYCTHSPLLIDTERFDQIRIFTKKTAEDNCPKITEITRTSLGAVASILETSCEMPVGTFTGETLRQRLRAVMTPQMNEGFFSRIVVLVEGIKDRSLVLGTALALGYDFESIGISVVYCNGKRNMDRPYAVFSSLKIPVYAVWDSDYENPRDSDKAIKFNREMCRLCDYPEQDYPEAITERFACIKTNLEKKFRQDVGEDLFDSRLKEYCDKYELGKGVYAIENPETIRALVERFLHEGTRSKTTEDIVSAIMQRYKALLI